MRILGDRVLIKPDAQSETTASGLHLAEHRKPDQMGTVIQVGEKVTAVRPGEYVLFSWAVGQELHFEDEHERLLMMRESDVLMVIGEDVTLETPELLSVTA